MRLRLITEYAKHDHLTTTISRAIIKELNKIDGTRRARLDISLPNSPPIELNIDPSASETTGWHDVNDGSIGINVGAKDWYADRSTRNDLIIKLKSVIQHELTHVEQPAEVKNPGTMPQRFLQSIKWLYDKAKYISDYLGNPAEIEAWISEIRRKAKGKRQPFSKEFFNLCGNIYLAIMAKSRNKQRGQDMAQQVISSLEVEAKRRNLLPKEYILPHQSLINQVSELLT